MGAAGIELPEFMGASVIERTYRRAVELQDHSREPWWNGGHHARRMREVGVRMAVARDPRMMLFLDKAAEYLRARSDEQKSRIAQLGYSEKHDEYSEAALFRTAYQKADEPRRDETALFDTWGWVYGAVAEALAKG